MTSFSDDFSINIHGKARLRQRWLSLFSLDLMLLRVAISLAMLFAMGSAGVAKQSKCDIVLKRIHTLLDLYDKEHPLKHYPSTLEEFQNFAAKKGQAFDLGVFSKFSYHRHGTSLDLSYTCKDTGRSEAEGLRSIIVY